MVKAKKAAAAKKAKSEETPEVEIKVESNIEEEIQEETSQENGEAEVSLKKKGRGKTTEKEDVVSDVEVKEEELDIIENGDEDTTEEEKPAAKKTKSTRKLVSKPVSEPARKSSRPPKPITNLGAEEDDDEDYEVDKLVGFRLQRGKAQYLVRWKGYTSKDDTWEEEGNLNCPDLIKKYKADFPNSIKKAKKRSTSKSPVKSAKKAKTNKEDEEDYEVEDIVGMRVKGGKKEFKIRWKGYDSSDDSWEPEKHLSCKDLIEKYLAEHEDEVEEEEKTLPAKKKTATKSSKGKKTKSK